MKKPKTLRGVDRRPPGPELLAPAGTKDAFWAAMEQGADAFYVGLKAFNARALARNFSLEEVAELTDAAHKNGRKLFVALNSLIKEHELGQVAQTLAALEAIGIDALIIQDLGAWRLARTYFPRLRLHASTLMTLHNSLGVRQAHAMGFDRVVLAREMTLDEVRTAVRAAPIETEVFVHGALCFSYSGLCLFSSFFGGKSSTRGRCVQPCRRRYSWGGRDGTFFSMNDLCGLDALEALKEAGVTSLKIEGRLKPPHYVASVVKAYRMMIDSPKGSKDAVEEARELLKNALGRPLTGGYFFSSRPRHAVSPARTANTGRYLGTVIEGSGRKLLIKSERPPGKGDRLRLVLKRDHGQLAFACRNVVPGAARNTYWIEGRGFPRESRGALVFKTDEARAPSHFSENRPDNRPVRYETEPEAGNRLREILREAAKRADELIRREGLRESDKISARPDRKSRRGAQVPGLWARLRDARHIAALPKPGLRGVFLEITPSNLRFFGRKPPKWSERMELVWALPPIIHEHRLAFFRKACSTLYARGYVQFQVSTAGQLSLFSDVIRSGAGRRRKRPVLWGSYSLNLLNSQALRAARDLGILRPQFSIESDRQNMVRALGRVRRIPTVLTVFGYLPLFTTRMDHSLYKGRRPVISPRGEKLHWRKSGEVCRLVPDRPFSLLTRWQDLTSIGFSDLVIDLSEWAGSKGSLKRLPGDLKTLARVLRGRSFNFDGRLE